MEEGGVGIVFHTSRGGRVLVVKSLVAGGAAERSCAVEVGHQIIAVGDHDVTSATLEEVAGLLRGPVNSQVQLRFLETRDVRLVVERTFTDRNGEATVGIKWKNAVGEFIVEGMLEEYSGFGGSPKPGDRLLRIDGESIDDMRDDEIRRKLAGDADSSVRLDFARGVAQHSVTLTRQALALAAITGKSIKSAADALRGSFDGGVGEHIWSSQPVQGQPATLTALPKVEPAASAEHNSNPESLPSTVTAMPESVPSADPLPEPAKPPPSKKEEDSVNQQLVDIVRRLKQELEGKQQEVVNLKAAHRKELEEAQVVAGASAESAQEIGRVKDLLRNAEQQLMQAEEEIRSKDAELTGVKNELNGVKSVLMRRAESIGDSKKRVDEIEAALGQANADREALTARCQHLESALEQSQGSIRELKATRELDEKNLRAAADAALKWQIQEVEKQAMQTKADLQAKTEEVSRANETIKIQAQSMMSWQSAQETTQTKLSAAIEELNRLRKVNEEYDTLAQRSQEEAETQKQRQAQVEKELERARAQMSSAEEQASMALQERDQGWERRFEEAEEVWKKKHAAQQTQIASQQDQLDVGETERAKLEESVAQAQQARKQASKEKEELLDKLKDVEAKVASTEGELEETRVRLEQASGRAEKLTDASHSWRDQLAGAQEQLESAKKTIEAQAKACLQENNRREEVEEKLERQLKEGERQQQELGQMQAQLRELKELRAQYELATEQLQSFEALKIQLQNDARQRQQMMQRVPPNMPYPQLMAMLHDSNSSVANLQGVVQAKDRELGVIRQQLTELSNVREMTVDAERQLMKLKEALDWKTITLQQMTAVLSSCQAAMQKHGMPIPEELLEQLSDVLALNSRRQEEDAASSYSQSPTALHSSIPNGKPAQHPLQPPAQPVQLAPPPPVPAARPHSMPGAAAVYGDPNLHTAVPPGAYGHQMPPSQIPLHGAMGGGGLHSSVGPGGMAGAPPPPPGHAGQGLHGSMGPGMGMPGGGPGPGFAPPNQSPPVGHGMATYPGQRESDFAMAM